MSDRIRTIRRRKGDKKANEVEQKSEEIAAADSVPEPEQKAPIKKKQPTGPKLDAKALQE